MVARTPPKQQQQKIRMVAPLNPTLLRETINKVDKCMARLQELQYTVTGGNKVVGGVTLSPRSTRGYLRTSLRCKQESLRTKNVNARRSPPGKLPTNAGDWRAMSLPAMLLGETVSEILQASQFTKEIAEAVVPKTRKLSPSDDPRTPMTERRKNKKPSPENSELRSRRKREKQLALQTIRTESERTPSLKRAKSRINFKVSPVQKKELDKENWRYMANRVSPRHRPWAKKTVLFPNPLFHSSSPTQQQKSCRTSSPVKNSPKKHLTPHKFLIKSPVKIRNPPLSLSPTRAASSCKKSTNPSSSSSSTAARLRRSFSPSRLASKLVSPLKSRKSVQKSDDGMKKNMMMMSGLKQRPKSTQMRSSAPRI